MTEKERLEILDKAKDFFRTKFIPNHLRNTKKLKNVKEFKINPFTHRYLANFFFGDDSPESLAKVLFYPRAMGSSLTTTFGMQMQQFCNEVLLGIGSTTQGIDIEFIDEIDGRKKYCQVKAGPQTINKDDVTTIKNHFKNLVRLARTNNLTVANSDCIVGILYGERKNLSANYKAIDKEYPVYIGDEFWERLTGDKDFYEKLATAFGEVAEETNAVEEINATITELAKNF